jgi:hypothetical protein
MRTMFEYKGTPVMVSKADGHWQVRAHGNVYAFRFLDQALSAALPSLTGREVDRLVRRAARPRIKVRCEDPRPVGRRYVRRRVAVGHQSRSTASDSRSCSRSLMCATTSSGSLTE